MAVSIDDGAWQATQGGTTAMSAAGTTSAWTYVWNLPTEIAQDHIVKVRAVDNRGNTGIQTFHVTVDNQPRTSLSLPERWAMVSFQVDPLDSAVSSILRPISDRVVVMYGYDGGAKSYYPAVPEPQNTLKNLDPLHGYWIKLTSGTSLNVYGSRVAQNAPITLTQGWNLNGYLPAASQPLTDALAEIDGLYTAVLSYDRGAQSFYTVIPPNMNTLHTMQPGRGYWLYMTQDAVLHYPVVNVSLGTALAERAFTTVRAAQLPEVTASGGWADFYSIRSTALSSSI